MAMRCAAGRRACTRQSTAATCTCGWSTDASISRRICYAVRARACGKARLTMFTTPLLPRGSRAVPLLLAMLPCAAHAQDLAPADQGGDVVVLGRGLALPPGTPANGAVKIVRVWLVGV